MILNHLLSSYASLLYRVYKEILNFCGLSLVSNFVTCTQFQIPVSPLNAKIPSASSAAADHVCYYFLPRPRRRTNGRIRETPRPFPASPNFCPCSHTAEATKQASNKQTQNRPSSWISTLTAWRYMIIFSQLMRIISHPALKEKRNSPSVATAVDWSVA